VKVAYAFADFGHDAATEQRWLAAASISSVRRHMPGVPIVHLSDLRTKTLDGVDEVIAREWTNRAELQAHLHGPVLFLDTDTILMRDVRHVFEKEFDVAVASRPSDWADADRAYNQGVVFSRNEHFWGTLSDLSKQRGRYGEEEFSYVVKSGEFKVLELPESYNFSPPDDLAVLHFKGPRKRMMLYV
jgi:hypothetical protein